MLYYGYIKERINSPTTCMFYKENDDTIFEFEVGDYVDGNKIVSYLYFDDFYNANIYEIE